MLRTQRTVLQRTVSWTALMLLAIHSSTAVAQVPAADGPEPIYWRQNLLTVPYQWSSASDGQTKAVWLYVSRDRGASWQLAGDGQSHLLSFNYRAEADGEFWFAVRTTDSRDVQMPASMPPTTSLQPELKVVVDTTVPRVESLVAQLVAANTLEVHWRIADANLGTQACTVEAQFGATGDWQPVPLRNELQSGAGVWDGTAMLILTSNNMPTAVRATVVDLANNRTRYQSSVGADGGPPTPAALDAFSAPGTTGWGNGPQTVTNQFVATAAPQPWPADRTGWMPATGDRGGAASVAYGTPLGVGEDDETTPIANSELRLPQPMRDDRPLGNLPLQHAPAPDRTGPFHMASTSQLQSVARPQPVQNGPIDMSRSASGAKVPPPPVNPLARRVNSRSFVLEYELADVGELGVARVEVWGTHDGGQSWQRYVVDEDNRSPVTITVDGEGEYGFSMLITEPNENSRSPQPGDTPALWVEVDLEPPIARILSVDAARGRDGGELTVTWEAEDEHLEPRPIALFYSSQPTGPWTPIATSIENRGEFTWPIERHVPRRVFLKLEARDAAGNSAAFQTAEAVVTESEVSVASWQRLPPTE
jgi:hypothetical protein